MKKAIKLQVGIATIFATLTILIIVMIVGYLYLAQTQLALKTASASMDRSGKEITRRVQNIFDPVIRVVDATSMIAKSDPAALRSVRGLKFFYRQIKALPQIYGLYVGFESDGSFFQVVHFGEKLQKFGPFSKPVGERTRYVVRLLDDRSGERLDSYVYMEDWGTVTKLEKAPTHFDPRKRPWYNIFRGRDLKDDVHISAPYLFSSTGRIGLTVSKSISLGNDNPLGVVGADIRFNHLTDFLNTQKIGEHGIVALIDQNEKLVIRSQDNKDAAQTGSRQVFSAIMKKRASNKIDKIELAEKISGSTYLANFYTLKGSFNKDWKIVVIADRQEFIGEIKRTSINIIIVAIGVMIVALILIIFLSRSLSTPIRRVVEETGRIQRFELEGDFHISSRIVEVRELTSAVENMKNNLKSFAAYVPKILVRNIASSGTEVKIGGESRPLTILFSDIKSFTKKSEKMTPEDIFTDLSVYFSAMSQAITENGGTVDKYIGDAVMALWNAPQLDDNHAVHACRAVLACAAACEKLNANAHLYNGLLPVGTRFGLHTGDVMVGNIGSSDRMQYTALGATVNLASRIEAINKIYGTDILITEPVREQISDLFVVRPIDVISPAGTSEPIEIYELLGETSKTSHLKASDGLIKKVSLWNEFYATYRSRDWAEALTRCKAFLQLYPEDGAALEYLKRCQIFVATPPPKDWNGVHVYTSK